MDEVRTEKEALRNAVEFLRSLLLDVAAATGEITAEDLDALWQEGNAAEDLLWIAWDDGYLVYRIKNKREA